MGLNKCSAQMSHPPSAVSQCNHPVAAVVGEGHLLVMLCLLSVNAIAVFLWASNSGPRWVSGGNGFTVACEMRVTIHGQ